MYTSNIAVFYNCSCTNAGVYGRSKMCWTPPRVSQQMLTWRRLLAGMLWVVDDIFAIRPQSRKSPRSMLRSNPGSGERWASTNLVIGGVDG